MAAEMALRKRAPGTGLQVLLEASGSSLVGELDHDKQRPGSMLHRVTARTSVVPVDSIIDIAGAADVVSRRVAFAAEDVNESAANTTHARGRGTSRAIEDGQ